MPINAKHTASLANRIALVLEQTLRAVLLDIETGLPSSHGEHGKTSITGFPPNLKVSDLLAEYERINASAFRRKSKAQVHKWRTARKTSVDTFIEIIGRDLRVAEITVRQAHELHDYWQQRVLKGEVRINSANRLMRNLTGLYSAAHNYHRLETKNPFSSLHIRGGREGKRLAYTAEFLQNGILAEGALGGLNPEARRLLYVIVETGLRPSEACALDASTIHLEEAIPYVRVTDDGRQTKTHGSIRTIPLVGVALAAMKLQPNGFPRYRNRADVASAVINKALSTKKLRPGGKMQTLYSLRHTLIDRLKAVEAPKDIQEDILGHVHMYGEGTTLQHRHAWLQRIAMKFPSRL